MGNQTPLASGRYDAIVVGAGLAGLYQLYSLRNLGLSVRVLEAGPDVGGTWYWNAYPGARCDVESMDYSYSFSPELDQEWTWTERYASQPEILAYIRHVADRFQLRPDIQFDTRVVAARWDEDEAQWHVRTEAGETFVARFCIFATGTLSAPLKPAFDGVDDFAGESYQTQIWPHKPVVFEGKRVGVIGTGSSGVQSIPEIAKAAKSVTVFQRTPNFCIPARNRPLTEEEIRERKAGYPEHRLVQRNSPSGVPLNVNEKTSAELTHEEQQAEMEERWAIGGAPVFNVSFSDVMTNKKTNDLVSDFVRTKIREKITDPALAELMVPTDHPIAAKRLCVDTNYFETFNLPHVSLVDVRSNPIRRIVESGIELEDGTVHELDMIVYAIGYDAISGPLLRIDITGTGGRSLRDEWADGPQSYMGLMIAGFPNLFAITGPGSPAVLAVMTVALEHDVEWVTQAIADLRESGYSTIEAEPEAQRAWTAEVAEIAAGTVFPLATNSYYLGANVPGKPKTFPLYAGGQNTFRAKAAEVVADGYRGFVRKA